MGIQLSLVLPKIVLLLFCIIACGFYQTLLMLLGSDSFFVSKATTHLALPPSGEVGVFHGHCTPFPVAHSSVTHKLVGPVGWESLGRSIVFDTSLELQARKQNGSALPLLIRSWRGKRPA